MGVPKRFGINWINWVFRGLGDPRWVLLECWSRQGWEEELDLSVISDCTLGPNRIHKKPVERCSCPQILSNFSACCSLLYKFQVFLLPLGYPSLSEVEFVPFSMPDSSPVPEAAGKAQPKKKQRFKTVEENLSNINVPEGSHRPEVGLSCSSSSLPLCPAFPFLIPIPQYPSPFPDSPVHSPGGSLFPAITRHLQ